MKKEKYQEAMDHVEKAIGSLEEVHDICSDGNFMIVVLIMVSQKLTDLIRKLNGWPKNQKII